MESIFALRVFVRVAECRSLVAAGHALGISASAVGKTIARLEDRVGIRLLHRNTRSVVPSAEGLRFLDRCRRILMELEAAEAEFSAAAAKPSGLLRVSLPVMGEPFISLLGRFTRAHPHVVLDAEFTDRSVDLIEEGYDVVLRSGDLRDSRLASKKLACYRMVLLASPAYLTRHGTPTRSDDLKEHVCIQFRYPDTGKLQPWRTASTGQAIAVKESMILSSIHARIESALQGIGIVYVADFAARECIDDGRLIPVLGDTMGPAGELNLLWARSRQETPKLRAFIDFMVGHLHLGL